MQAVSYILASLPAEFAAPIIVAQHRGQAGSIDLLVHLLAVCTKLRIKSAGAQEYMRAGCVYVCPAYKHIELISADLLCTREGPPIQYVRPSCNLLFESMATNLGERGICVVLSSNGTDGALATRAVRRSNGLVIAQTESSAAYSEMPIAAMELGNVDLVLPLRDIPFALMQLVTPALPA